MRGCLKWRTITQRSRNFAAKSAASYLVVPSENEIGGRGKNVKTK